MIQRKGVQDLECDLLKREIKSDLLQMTCVDCCKGEPALTDEIKLLHPQIPEWQVQEVDGMERLEPVFEFKNFAQVLEFTNNVGSIAGEEDHYPLIAQNMDEQLWIGGHR